MSRIKIALYPGTFDPITYGHLDIIKRSTDFVDKLYIGIANNRKKKVLFFQQVPSHALKKEENLFLL